MSKTEIILELPKLKPEDRREIQAKLNELDGAIGEEWGEDELTATEKAVVNARLDECDKNPNAFVPWEEAEARLKAQFGA